MQCSKNSETFVIEAFAQVRAVHQGHTARHGASLTANVSKFFVNGKSPHKEVLQSFANIGSIWNLPERYTYDKKNEKLDSNKMHL